MGERSETARRNTNLFTLGVRRSDAGVPFAEHLIHRTLRGELVRSKSAVIVANLLHNAGIDYSYERELEGARLPDTIRPDFTFIDPAGDPIVWERLGLLDRDDYRLAWERRRAWYEVNAFRLDENLFTSVKRDGAIDSAAISRQIEKLRDLLE